MKLQFKLCMLAMTLGAVLANNAKPDSLSTDPSCTPAGVCTNDWITAPTPFTGPPVTVNGVTSLFSSWTDGTYVDRNGVQQTANVTLHSSVSDLGNGSFQYIWVLTNNGTGDIFQFFDAGPGQGPNFLQPPVPLVAGDSQLDSLIGGPPVLGQWGARWNSGVGASNPMAENFEATPEPTTTALGGLGLAGLALLLGRARPAQKE